MPDVTGMKEAEAKKTLEDSGLQVGVTYEKSDSVPVGSVISSDPVKDSDVRRGDKVTIIVSSGEDLIKVENVVGKKQSEAENTLDKQGFAVYVRENYDDTVPKGNVISQSPAAGTSQAKGSTITIIVSKGKQGITVNLDANGGTVSQKTAAVYINEAYGKLAEPVRDGYKFAGWFTAKDDGKQIYSETKVTTAVEHTIYAHWTANNYEVRFDANGGSVKTDRKNVTYGKKYGELPTPNRGGYGFDGWFTEKSGGQNITAGSEVKITGTQTLYAHWTAGKVTVALNGNGGVSPKGSISVTYNETYGTIPIPERAGYSFTGWFTNAVGGSRVTASTKVTNKDSHTLYARWKALEYEVRLDPGKGSLATKSVKVTYDSPYGNLPAPDRTGYTFAGWYTAESGGKKIESNTLVDTAKAHTLYAHWTLNTYKITFNANGGTVTPETMNVGYGQKYGDIPKPSQKGYTFTGWYTAESGGERIKAETEVKITNDQTLYARWNAKQYTITLDANGGTVTSQTVTVTFADKYGNLPTPTRTGHQFSGWYSKADGGTRITADNVVRAAKNHTLYAHWNEVLYNLYYNENGGNQLSGQRYKMLAYNTAYGELPTPTKDYCDFAGWFTAKDGGTQVSSSTVMSNNDMTIYAHWKNRQASGWVLESNAPSGAKITDTKWTYTLKEYTTSSSSSKSGWTKYDTKRTDWGSKQGPVYSDPSNGVRNVTSEQYVSSTTHHWKYYHRKGWGYNTGTGSNGYVFGTDGSLGSGERHAIDITWSLDVYQYNFGGLGVTAFKGYNCPNCGEYYCWFSDGEYDANQYATRWYYQDPVYTYYYYRYVDKESTSNPSGNSNVSNVKKWVRYIAK